MAKVRVFISIALITLLLALIGCGGGNEIFGLRGKTHGDGSSPALQVLDSKFGIPSPSEAISHTNPRTGSAAMLVRQGADFEAGLAQNATVTGQNATFSPNWTGNTSAFDTLAYAIYRFNLAGYAGEQNLKLTWTTPPVDYAKLWIGFSRWGLNRWDWYPGPASDILDLTATGFLQYTQPGTSDLLIAVVMLGAVPDMLQELRVGGAGRGDWWMFGHDPHHTRRSPFTGPATAVLKWTYTTGDLVQSSPAIGADGTVYVGSNVELYAISPEGSLKWVCTAGGYINSSPAVSADGTVYVGSNDNNLYAINPDGSSKWSYATGGAVYSSPAISADGTVYVGSGDGKLYAINSDGSLKWDYLTGYVVESSPAMGEDGIVYVGSDDNNLYAIKPDGSLKWVFNTGDMVFSSPAINANGTVYVGSYDNYLYAINPDGSMNWSYAIGNWVGSSAAIAADGTAYVGSNDQQHPSNSKLYAINQDGSVKWAYAAGGPVDSSPAIDADGTVYVGSWDNKFYAINPDGSLKWQFTTGDDVYSSPAIGADGTVYVGSNDCKLYAFGPGESGDQTPIAELTATPSDGAAPLDVSFDADSSYDPDGGSITKYEWDWTSDGIYDWDSGAIATAIHQYAAAGDYAATVRVTDDELTTDTATSAIIHVTNSGNQPPIADLTANPSSGAPPLSVLLNASGSYDTDGSIAKYEFDFGEGGGWQDNGASATISHTYNSEGVYTATVRVTDNDSATDTATADINVSNGGNQPPIADLTANPSSGAPPMNVLLNASGSYDTDGSITKYEFDFGEGGGWQDNGTNATIFHNYGTEGVYTATVRVTDNDSATDTATASINVSNGGSEIWHTYRIVTEGDYNCGQGASLNVVAGMPAISYVDGQAANGGLSYIRATHADGITWGAPVELDTHGGVPDVRDTKLLVVNGNPAIGYATNSGLGCRFIRSNDQTGTAWSSPIEITSASSVYIAMCVVNGNPAIVFKQGSPLKYVRANDAAGANWPSTYTTLSSSATLPDIYMLSTGVPAAAFLSDGGTDYDVVTFKPASDSNGATWADASIVDSTDWNYMVSILLVGGNPALVYTHGGNLYYTRANTSQGDSWPPAPVNLAGNIPGWLGRYASFAIINGKPAVAFGDTAYTTANGKLWYKSATDSLGNNWSSAELVDGSADTYVHSQISLQQVNGHPAIAYNDNNNHDLKYAIKY
jgi:outer membrane protein assembly factor BamB